MADCLNLKVIKPIMPRFTGVNYYWPTDLISHLLTSWDTNIMKETANIREYKVGIVSAK